MDHICIHLHHEVSENVIVKISKCQTVRLVWTYCIAAVFSDGDVVSVAKRVTKQISAVSAMNLHFLRICEFHLHSTRKFAMLFHNSAPMNQGGKGVTK